MPPPSFLGHLPPARLPPPRAILETNMNFEHSRNTPGSNFASIYDLSYHSGAHPYPQYYQPIHFKPALLADEDLQSEILYRNIGHPSAYSSSHTQQPPYLPNHIYPLSINTTHSQNNQVPFSTDPWFSSTLNEMPQAPAIPGLSAALKIGELCVDRNGFYHIYTFGDALESLFQHWISQDVSRRCVNISLIPFNAIA